MLFEQRGFFVFSKERKVIGGVENSCKHFKSFASFAFLHSLSEVLTVFPANFYEFFLGAFHKTT
jgi:hypothetical protein